MNKVHTDVSMDLSSLKFSPRRMARHTVTLPKAKSSVKVPRHESRNHALIAEVQGALTSSQPLAPQNRRTELPAIGSTHQKVVQHLMKLKNREKLMASKLTFPARGAHAASSKASAARSLVNEHR